MNEGPQTLYNERMTVRLTPENRRMLGRAKDANVHVSKFVNKTLRDALTKAGYARKKDLQGA